MAVTVVWVTDPLSELNAREACNLYKNSDNSSIHPSKKEHLIAVKESYREYIDLVCVQDRGRERA